MADQQFDIVVLGGGSAGYATALRAKQLGYSVALIEKEKLGGTCLHRGCVPTKALLHSAEIADVAREGAKYGVTSSVEGIDIAGVLGFKDNLVAGKFKGLQGLIKANGIADKSAPTAESHVNSAETPGLHPGYAPSVT